MRASTWLRHRAQMNRTRYATRILATDVLPSLVQSMQVMNGTLRIQSGILARHLEAHGSADPGRIAPDSAPDQAGTTGTENHENGSET